jgi:hypothetical protein
MAQESSEGKTGSASDTRGPAGREQDAIYQGDRIVGRVAQPDVDLEAKELRIGEIYNSDQLMIPEECEFQRYRILIQRIAYATRIDRAEPHKGRILRGVTADIQGYREQ